jgi:hypothetical protein
VTKVSLLTNWLFLFYVDEEGVEDFGTFFGAAATVHGRMGGRRYPEARRRRAVLTRQRHLESVPAVVHGEDPNSCEVCPAKPSPRPRASVSVPLPTGSDPQHLSKFFCIKSN